MRFILLLCCFLLTHFYSDRASCAEGSARIVLDVVPLIEPQDTYADLDSAGLMRVLRYQHVHDTVDEVGAANISGAQRQHLEALAGRVARENKEGVVRDGEGTTEGDQFRLVLYGVETQRLIAGTLDLAPEDVRELVGAMLAAGRTLSRSAPAPAYVRLSPIEAGRAADMLRREPGEARGIESFPPELRTLLEGAARQPYVMASISADQHQALQAWKPGRIERVPTGLESIYELELLAFSVGQP